MIKDTPNGQTQFDTEEERKGRKAMTTIDSPEFQKVLDSYDAGVLTKAELITIIDAKITEAVNYTSSQPWLGNATTAELLNELTVRAKIHGYANYRTVD